MSVRWFAESFTRLTCVMNTTFGEKIYSRWCCIDRLSRHRLSGLGRQNLAIPISACFRGTFVASKVAEAYDLREPEVQAGNSG
jgi:hypothetical protein